MPKTSRRFQLVSLAALGGALVWSAVELCSLQVARLTGRFWSQRA